MTSEPKSRFLSREHFHTSLTPSGAGCPLCRYVDGACDVPTLTEVIAELDSWLACYELAAAIEDNQ